MIQPRAAARFIAAGELDAAMPFAKAIKAAEVPEGEVAGAVVGGRTIAIIHRGGSFFALDGVCTHMGGPLGEGTLDGDELVCPWHEGRYNVRTGEANPETDWVRNTKTFPTKVEGGYVWVDV